MKVLIAGYYGFGNLGDELILATILSQLKERDATIVPTVLSGRPEETTRLHGVRAVSRWSASAILKEMWNTDFLLLGGGGLLQDSTSERSMLYYLSLVALARFFRSPVVLYAIGVEKIRRGFWKPIIRFLFSDKSVKITVRDDASKAILSEMGIPRKTIHVTGDPVFCRNITSVPRERYGFPTRSALVVPRFPCPPIARTLYQTIHRVLQEDEKAVVSWKLFQPESETESFETLGIKPDTEVLLYDPGDSVDEMAERVGSFDWVISARFHGLVLAALAGRPFIGVGDPDKVGRLCRSWNMPFLYWNATETHVREALRQIGSESFVFNPEFLARWRKAASQTIDIAL